MPLAGRGTRSKHGASVQLIAPGLSPPPPPPGSAGAGTEPLDTHPAREWLALETSAAAGGCRALLPGSLRGEAVSFPRARERYETRARRLRLTISAAQRFPSFHPSILPPCLLPPCCFHPACSIPPVGAGGHGAAPSRRPPQGAGPRSPGPLSRGDPGELQGPRRTAGTPTSSRDLGELQGSQ